MKKQIIFSVLVLILMVATSSATAQVITVKKTKWIGPGHMIKWHEYRTDQGVAVKHGLYVEQLNGEIILKGEYRHGRKQGRWIRWGGHEHNRRMETMIYQNGRLIDSACPIYSKKYTKVVKIKRPPVISISLPHLRVYCRL